MYEKVNPMHPDKIADRIAGAIVDLAYSKDSNAKMACEVLIGHGICHVICETNVEILLGEVQAITSRIVQENHRIELQVVSQDEHLANNQANELRCGDNGIFKGMPITDEQKKLSEVARYIYQNYKSDGKYIYSQKDSKLIICQSMCLGAAHLNKDCPKLSEMLLRTLVTVNPLGAWTGGINVDSGATNRKLGSDMGDAVTGGGLHGKDLSKADVSLNIYAHLKAQETGKPVELYCAIGDDKVDGKPYYEIVEIAKNYINDLGGFEKLAEWGLI